MLPKDICSALINIYKLYDTNAISVLIVFAILIIMDTRIGCPKIQIEWPEKWPIDLTTLKYIKIAFQSGITLEVLYLRQYVKRLDENC